MWKQAAGEGRLGNLSQSGHRHPWHVWGCQDSLRLRQHAPFLWNISVSNLFKWFVWKVCFTRAPYKLGRNFRVHPSLAQWTALRQWPQGSNPGSTASKSVRSSGEKRDGLGQPTIVLWACCPHPINIYWALTFGKASKHWSLSCLLSIKWGKSVLWHLAFREVKIKH